MNQLVLDLHLPQPKSFDDFVRGENAELLFQLSQWASGDRTVRAIYIWGEHGAGKSYLLAAAKERLIDAHTVYLVNAKRDMLPQTLPSDAALIVDNVENLDAEQQIVLFDHYNTLREGNGRILVSGHLPPMLLPLRDDLTTRLGWGLIYQLKTLSDTDKAAALQRHARSLGFELSEELVDYLMRHAERDLPNLYRQIDSINALSLSKQRPVTIALLREALKNESA
ncbi:DnaA regulatory inactivator Hda [Deefgea piscis]|uniref:DnaA regulatory inactivator Hda n=2 Tax=Deefgea TaxID=400947 RepID=UPI001C7E7F0C|nr:DnaA regulatory inactivator Hda [Deefgea piscis]QZA80536.1 DnaA regulatory inactivator Hda [Deefgea piscis]